MPMAPTVRGFQGRSSSRPMASAACAGDDGRHEQGELSAAAGGSAQCGLCPLPTHTAAPAPRCI